MKKQRFIFFLIGLLFVFKLSLFSQSKSDIDSIFSRTYNYMRLDDYYKASKLIDSVLVKLKNANNKFEKGRFLTLKAAVYEALEEFESSKKYNLQAMREFKSINEDYYYNWTLIILMSNYVANGEFNDFFKLLPEAKSKNINDFFLFYIYQSELEAYYKQNKYEKILYVVDDMSNKLDTTQFKEEQFVKETYNYKAMYKIFKAFSLMKTNKNKEAEPLINELLRVDFKKMFWLDEDVLKYEPDIYKYKYDILFKANRFDSLKFYHDKYVSKNKEFFNFVKARIKKNKKIMLQILNNEKKTIQENVKLKIERQRRKYFAIITISVIFIVFALWFGLSKFKHAKIIKEKNFKIIELNATLEKSNFDLRKKNVKNQELIMANERGIFSKIIQISTLRDKIKKITLDLTEAIKDGNDIKVIDLFRIENSLKSVITENEIWEEFRLQFENIRPLFFKKLKEINSSLSVNDLKHCAYVATNLKTKDVANLIYISPRSVETIRYRLRKKLNIPKEIKLYDFLNAIDEEIHES